MKILYAADLHIGANKFGVDSDTWNNPLWEIVEHVKENEIEWVVVCGDAFHKRHPTTDELNTYRHWVQTLGGYGAVVVDIAGNHDYGVRADSLPASDFFDEVFTYRGRVQGLTVKSPEGQPKLQIVAVPWPRLVDYVHLQYPNEIPIDKQLRLAAQEVEVAIEQIVSDFDGQSIIAGHLHVWYGGSSNRRDVDGPGLMMGRDILVSHSRLSGIPNMIDIQLGHIHNPGNGYVGSTQPTDFADTNPKSFVVVDYEIENDPSGEFGAMWAIKDWQRVPYLSALKVKDFTLNTVSDHYTPGKDDPNYQRFDIVRGSAQLGPSDVASPVQLRQWLEGWGKVVLGATVIPYRGESRAAALDADGLDLSDPRVAVGAWLAERKIEDRELELEVRYEVDSLLTTATAGD